jgi:hypothetical protein
MGCGLTKAVVLMVGTLTQEVSVEREWHSVKIPKALVPDLRRAAVRDRRSLQAQVAYYCEEGLRRQRPGSERQLQKTLERLDGEFDGE